MKMILTIFARMQKPDRGIFAISIIIAILSPLLGDIIAPIFAASFTKHLADKSPADIIEYSLLILITILCTRTIIWRLGNFFLIQVQQRTLHRIATYSASYLLQLSMGFFREHNAGELVGKQNKFLRAYERMYDEVFFNFIPSMVIFICIMPVLLIKVPIIGAGIVLIGGVFAFMTWRFSLWIEPHNDEVSKADSRVTGVFADQLTNIATIQSFGRIEEEQDFYTMHDKTRSEKRKIAWLRGYVQWSANDFFQLIMSSASYFIALHYWKLGNFTIADVILITTYTNSLAGKLANIGNIMRNIKTHQSDAREFISNVLEVQSHIVDNGTLQAPSGGDIVFDNITFGYSDEIPIFQDFNLTIKKGEKIGIVGSSGSGKSTLIKLITREMDVLGGDIRYGDIKIKDINLKSLRKSISLVSQDPALFNRSIRNNINYANPEADFDEIIECAKKAQAHDFILKTSSKTRSGYDTRVGDRGIKLSGGERQRIALARAFLAKRHILILDEATSALDSISEKAIQTALEELLKEKGTIIAIAHRLATIQKMDRILVMQHGKIIEEGTHESLFAKNGAYTKLVHAQNLL